MAVRREDTKARMWQERLARYGQSNLTVAKFCAQEGVSVASFYYWAKRQRRRLEVPSSVERQSLFGARQQSREVASRPTNAAASAESLVRFYFHAAVEVSVPAHCVEAIRCLAECAQHSRREVDSAFREVVVGTR